MGTRVILISLCSNSLAAKQYAELSDTFSAQKTTKPQPPHTGHRVGLNLSTIDEVGSRMRVVGSLTCTRCVLSFVSVSPGYHMRFQVQCRRCKRCTLDEPCAAPQTITTHATQGGMIAAAHLDQHSLGPGLVLKDTHLRHERRPLHCKQRSACHQHR